MLVKSDDSKENLKMGPIKHGKVGDRRSKILSLAKEVGEVRVFELAQKLGVSEGTVRADLRHLEEEGCLQRVPGGAIGIEGTFIKPKMTPFEARMQRFRFEKEEIARYVVSNFINDGDVLLVDASTTTTLLVKEIVERSRDVTIITNAVNFCDETIDSSGITLILTGGELQKTNFSLVGEVTSQFLKNLQVDKAFLGTTCVLFDEGLMTVTTGEAEVKRLMIKAAKEVYILATHGKIGRRLEITPFAGFIQEGDELKIYPHNLSTETRHFKIVTDDNFATEEERDIFEAERKKFLPFKEVFDAVHLSETESAREEIWRP